MNYLVIERKELYDLVWSKPITKIAVDYGISDSMVIKICKKLGVLRPGLGHWAKVAAGKKVRQLPLGKLPKDCQEKYHLSSHARNSKHHAFTQYEPPHPLVELELSDELKVTVADDLVNPHTLVARNIKAFNNAKATDKLTLKPRAKNYFDIHVTEGTKERALRIMDALMHAFDKRGWSFKLSSEPEVSMTVTVLDESIRFHLEEKIKHVEHVLTDKEVSAKAAGKWIWPPRYDLVASGNLSIHIHAGYRLINRHSWSDGKVQRVENCLNKFCIVLIELAEAIKLDRIKRDEEERQREIARLKRQELKDARKAELTRREGIETDFARWDKANRLRQYISEFEASMMIESASPGDITEKEQWLAWAKNYADLIDPLAEGESTVVEETEGMYLDSW